MKFKSKPAKLYWIFGLIVVILLLILGMIMLFSNLFSYVPLNFRIIIGFFIISYGAFRLVSIYQKTKYQNDEEETE